MRLKQDIRSLSLIPAGGGKFEIRVNGKRIYSKLETGEFPESAVILKTVRSEVQRARSGE